MSFDDENLKISDEELKSKTSELRNMIECEPTHVQVWRTDDEFLERFLYCAKMDLQKAYTRYQNYYSNIVNIPGINDVLNGDYEWLMEAMKRMIKNMPMNFYGLDQYGRGIMTFQAGNMDMDDPHALFASIIMSIIYMDYLMEAVPEFKKIGVVYFEDHGTMTMKHYKSMMMDMKLQKVLSDLFQGGLPVRMKSCIICNEPVVFSVVWKIFKLFLSKKMLSRIMLVGKKHSDAIEKVGSVNELPDFLDGGLNTRSESFALTDEILEKHLKKAFPFNSH